LFSDELKASGSEGGTPALYSTCPFGLFYSIYANTTVRNTYRPANRKECSASTARTFLIGEDSTSKFQSSTLPYSTTKVLDLRRSSCFRFSDFSTLPTGWLQQPHFAKCAQGPTGKPWYETTQLSREDVRKETLTWCGLHDYKHCASLCVASPSVRGADMHYSEETSSMRGGAIDPTVWSGPMLSMTTVNQ
jgi:hypothetical protein